MAYIRHDKDNNPVSPQPGNINVTDTFGNVNDFWHVDYEKKDIDNNLITTNRDGSPLWDPNSPQNVTRPSNPDVLFFDTQWTRRLVDNTAGVKKQYVQSPLFPGVPFIVPPTETVYLAAETDHDLRIISEDGMDIMAIAFSEDITVTQTSTTTGYLLLNETGDREVTNEAGNPVEL